MLLLFPLFILLYFYITAFTYLSCKIPLVFVHNHYSSIFSNTKRKKVRSAISRACICLTINGTWATKPEVNRQYQKEMYMVGKGKTPISNCSNIDLKVTFPKSLFKSNLINTSDKVIYLFFDKATPSLSH
jgi:hypothetical protein